MTLGTENVFSVSIEENFAIIDKNKGMIYIVDKDNHEKYQAQEEFEILHIERSIVQCATSSNNGWGQGGKPKTHGFDGLDGFEEI